jgi:hypothetical protein
MPDPTGPELLDALERLVEAARRVHHASCTEEEDGASCDLSDAYESLPERDPVGLVTRLRSLLRTPEETAVLRAALEWREAMVSRDTRNAAKLGDWLNAVSEKERALFYVLDDLQPERMPEIMKEGKTDG